MNADLPSRITPPHTHSSMHRVAIFRNVHWVKEKGRNCKYRPQYHWWSWKRKRIRPQPKKPSVTIRVLGLTKSRAELSVTWIKVHKLQVLNVTKHFILFHWSGWVLPNVTSLFEAIRIACSLNEWHLFIDRSARSLKVVLLDKGNLSYPLAHLMYFESVTISTWGETTLGGIHWWRHRRCWCHHCTLNWTFLTS